MTVSTGGKAHIVKKISSNGKFFLAWKPKDYPMTPQQKRVQAAAAKCGIKKGSKPTAQNFACIKAEFGYKSPS